MVSLVNGVTPLREVNLKGPPLKLSLRLLVLKTFDRKRKYLLKLASPVGRTVTGEYPVTVVRVSHPGFSFHSILHSDLSQFTSP